MLQKLFPPYLNKGSRGPAVVFLQYLLFALGFAVEGMVPDGDYGEKTAASVRNFQIYLYFVGSDRDGNFGPGIRRSLKDRHGIDVDAVLVAPGTGTTWWVGQGSAVG